jgi:hypothetical protein
MPSVYESILSELGPDAIAQIGQQLGVDQQTAQQGVQAGLPLLLAALARNAGSDTGARSLSGALVRDHDGSALNNVPAALNSYRQGEGDGILRHVFGEQRPVVEQRLSQQAGVDGGALLQMLAPLVLAQLGKMQRQENLDAGGIAGALRQEEQQLQGGGLLDLVGQLLGGALGAGGGSSAPGSTSGGGLGGLSGAVGGGALTQLLLSSLGPALIQRVSAIFGIDEQTAQRVLMVAIPLLLAALARNASTPQGADSLFGALQRDHDGNVLSHMDEVFANPRASNGDKIVRKVLGNQAPTVAQTLTEQTGLDGERLLQTLAPIVLGALGLKARREHLDAGGLAATLQEERGSLEQSHGDVMDVVGQLIGGQPGESQPGGDLLGALGRLLSGR